ncbi:hypothetical protein Gogos_022424 [Gossypium gossypioides]|uniref:Uncharacterized protein n=1 Tax=Gossypium gossypioides TaxID=34282 RepID=A0A7J9D2J7_GOSGO|nr:hypothetical protein [Gossypium gossypioides]
MERGFLIMWKIMWLSELCQKRHNARKVKVWPKDMISGTMRLERYSTLIMGICLICLI